MPPPMDRRTFSRSSVQAGNAVTFLKTALSEFDNIDGSGPSRDSESEPEERGVSELHD
jgi:hypothetical protein